MTLVAVTPSKFVRGVESRETDWRLSEAEREAYAAAAHAEGRDKREVAALRRGTRACFDVVEFVEALGRTYDDDAHLVSYVVSREGVPLAAQPRVNKPGLGYMLEQGFELASDVLVVDVDNPGHAEWTPSAHAEALALYPTLEVLATAGVYHTAHGARLVQPLDEPVSVSEVERYLEAWLDDLERAGLAPDRTCRDWTRLMRLPHVRRGRVDFRSPFVSLERMQPRRIIPAPAAPKDRPRALAAGRPLAPWARSAPSCRPAGRSASP